MKDVQQTDNDDDDDDDDDDNNNNNNNNRISWGLYTTVVTSDGQNEYSVCSWKALQIYRKYTEYIFVKHKAIPMTMLRWSGPIRIRNLDRDLRHAHKPLTTAFLPLWRCLHCKRKRAYIEYEIIIFSMHNSTGTQNVLTFSTFSYSQWVFYFYSVYNEKCHQNLYTMFWV